MVYGLSPKLPMHLMACSRATERLCPSSSRLAYHVLPSATARQAVRFVLAASAEVQKVAESQQGFYTYIVKPLYASRRF